MIGHGAGLLEGCDVHTSAHHICDSNPPSCSMSHLNHCVGIMPPYSDHINEDDETIDSMKRMKLKKEGVREKGLTRMAFVYAV